MSKKSSPCLYMLLGCGLAVVLAIAAVIAIFALLARQGQKWSESISDPEQRAEKVSSILGAPEIPEGYYPMMGFSIPFVLDLAMLSDRPPGEDGEPQGFAEKGFIYLDSRDFQDNRSNLVDYLEGRTDDLEFLDNTSIDLENDEPLRRGRFQMHGTDHLYAAFRGEVDTGDTKLDGIQVLTYVDCGDSRVRMGIWFGPDPLPDGPPEELELTGTPADEAALMEFWGALDVCP